MIGINYVNHMLIYDKISGIITWRAHLFDKFIGKEAGKICGNYQCITLLGKKYQTHRLIWLIVTGDWPQNQIDHINRVSTDNRWCNLRDVTAIENVKNRKIYNDKNNIPGVSYIPKNKLKPWRATYKSKRLGSFATKQEAINARKQAEENYNE